MDRLTLEDKKFLQEYSIEDYARPSLTVDIGVFSVQRGRESFRSVDIQNLQVLLIKRGQSPFKDVWALPGGFCIPFESVDDTARRELAEETGVSESFVKLVGTFSDVGRDPRGWIISQAFLSIVEQDKVSLRAGSDAWEAEWFTVGQADEKITLTHGDTVLRLGENSLAFDHDKILETLLRELQENVRSGFDLVFRFLPQRFTLGEAEAVYRLVLGLDKDQRVPNFRRMINPYVVDTGVKSDKTGQFKSTLFEAKN